jgi:hypothetical protein
VKGTHREGASSDQKGDTVVMIQLAILPTPNYDMSHCFSLDSFRSEGIERLSERGDSVSEVYP